ncbi:MAG: portal protein, partial [Oceanospirillum sp.]|nr:portal protein [Oceanospirillum sp.]
MMLKPENVVPEDKLLTIEQLKKLHDKAYNSSQQPREEAANDLAFYWVTQWDDGLLGDSSLAYKGQFDILRKAGRQIMADLQENPVQVDFDPKDETRSDAGELMDGVYRSDDRYNYSIESYSVGAEEAVVCGFGAWELYNDYVSDRAGNDYQMIKRSPIYEANNLVMWDPNGKLKDKSDADYVSVLTSFSEEGYRELIEDMTGEDPGPLSDFKQPETSYSFPWFSSDKKVYLTHFYQRVMVKEKAITLTSPITPDETITVSEHQLTDVMDELIDAGYEVAGEREFCRYRVLKYIADGECIRKIEVVPGEHIPVVPVYGERYVVESVEGWEGITRLAKDPQRLRNFQLSYLADIVSRSPRPKPIFYSEQLDGFRDMYEEAGADNNLPYLLINRMTADGMQELPGGPSGVMPEQQIPQALIASIGLSREAVEDVANPGLPQDIA